MHFNPSRIPVVERTKSCRPMRREVKHPTRKNADGGILPQRRNTVPPIWIIRARRECGGCRRRRVGYSYWQSMHCHPFRSASRRGLHGSGFPPRCHRPPTIWSKQLRRRKREGGIPQSPRWNWPSHRSCRSTWLPYRPIHPASVPDGFAPAEVSACAPGYRPTYNRFSAPCSSDRPACGEQTADSPHRS